MTKFAFSKTPSIVVDLAGNTEVLRSIYQRLGDDLRYHCQVGATHWRARTIEPVVAGVEPVLFFAPTQIEKRVKDWGAPVLQERTEEAWLRFRDSSYNWLTVVHGYGVEAVINAYKEVLAGLACPNEGHVLSLS